MSASIIWVVSVSDPLELVSCRREFDALPVCSHRRWLQNVVQMDIRIFQLVEAEN